MSRNSQTIYFYFRFHKDFFTNEKIRNMKHVPMYGYIFIVIYLELCCLSIENNGFLKIDKTVQGKPYILDLAKDIGEDPETVSMAFTYFLNNELVEVVEEERFTEVFIEQVHFNTGKSSDEADKRRVRRLIKNQRKQGLLPENIPDVNEYIEGKGIFKNVYITENEKRVLEEKYSNVDFLIAFWSRQKEMEKQVVDSDYEVLLKIAADKGKNI